MSPPNIGPDAAALARAGFEVDLPAPWEPLAAELKALPIVRKVEVVGTLQAICGQRVIIMGGGGQVGQADVAVTDPVQAGVMTVMAIADTAKSAADRLQRRVS